mgnify:CR=1 FL=1
MENIIRTDVTMKLIAQFILFLSLFTCFYSQASQNLDVDGNGKADILWRNQVTGQNWLWTMNGVVVDESKSLNTIGLHWDIVGRGDFDGDGKSDIFWRNNESGRNYIYLMDGFTIRGSTELNYLPYFDWKVRGVTDVNGDGMDDVIWRHQTTGRTWLYTIDGVSIIDSKGLNTVADLNWQIVGTGDINGDGKGDIIWRHKTSGANYIWLMNGTNILDSYVLNTVPTSWHIVGVGDLDGDNTDDIIWRSESGLNWAYLMNDGQIGTSKQINTIANLDWQIRTVGDLNGDGKADIFWRNQSTGKTYAYLMDGTNILSAGYSSVISLNWKIITESTLPTSEPVTPEPEPEPEPEVDEAQVYYSANVSAQIVQSKCILCHTTTGSASSTRLQFEKSTTANYQAINQQRIADFLALDGVDSTYLLTKAQGGLTHGGGSQIVFGSDEYEALSTYLGLVTGGGSGGSSSGDFWEGVEILDSKQTLRKAALILSGRIPTGAEYASVADGKDASLKTAIKAVMKGDGFHDFLTDGANDRLLTHRFKHVAPDFLNASTPQLPDLIDLHHQAHVAGGEALDEFYRQHDQAYVAFGSAATELIAYVVENEKPYSEILTADYTMVNSRLSQYYGSNATFVDENNPNEMVPAKLNKLMLHADPLETEFTQEFGLEILVDGPTVSWPHAGILNDPAFLSRYPSTATNRNRARSRWTQYFFLDFDIEKSAARTNDPDALADQNNPTMNNPNCTVCHIPMDPIAGAFQNYGDVGFYRDQWEGMDSLPETYKWQEDGSSPYQEGDTWYRDMRTPGFYGETVPDADHSLQWLAEQIIQDDRFATSAVKFWWPAIVGSKPVYAPEISSDYDYDSKTAVYNAQSAFINEVSNSLREHMNLKDTLVDVVMSKWFRASKMTEEAASVHASNYTGIGRLLSPELLDKKTKKLVGIEDFPEIEIPKTWVWQSLDESSLRITDGTHFSPKSTSSGDFMYITSKNVRAGYIDLTKISYVDEITHRGIYKRCDVKKGDVLYVKDGANTGLACVNTIEEEISLLSSVGVFKVCSFVNPKYLEHYLNSPMGRKLMLGMMGGTAIPRLTLTKLAKAPFSLPPIKEQTQIVRRVEELFAFADQIEKQVKNAQARVNNLTQSILAKAFRGELTAQWRADNPDLISGENSAAALLAKIQAEREALKPKKKTAQKTKAKKEAAN